MRYVRESEGTGMPSGIGAYMGKREFTQMGTHLVKHWDAPDVDEAFQLVRKRENELIARGSATPMNCTATAVGLRNKENYGASLSLEEVKGSLAEAYKQLTEAPQPPVPTRPAIKLPKTLMNNALARQEHQLARLNGDVQIAPEALSNSIEARVLQAMQLNTQPPEESMDSYTNEEWAKIGVVLGLVDVREGVYLPTKELVQSVGKEGLNGWFSDGLKKIGRWVKKTYNAVKEGVKKAAAWVYNKAGQLVRYIGGKVQSFYDYAKKIAGKSLMIIRKGVAYIWDKTKGLMMLVGDTLQKVVRYTAEICRAFAQKLKEIAQKFVRYLNPKNVIARNLVTRKIRKNTSGIANGVIAGILDRAQARMREEDYRKSRRAYEKLLRDFNSWGGETEVLRKAIRAGYNPKENVKLLSEAELKASVESEASTMNQEELLEEARRKVYEDNGVPMDEYDKYVSEKEAAFLEERLGVIREALATREPPHAPEVDRGLGPRLPADPTIKEVVTELDLSDARLRANHTGVPEKFRPRGLGDPFIIATIVITLISAIIQIVKLYFERKDKEDEKKQKEEELEQEKIRGQNRHAEEMKKIEEESKIRQKQAEDQAKREVAKALEDKQFMQQFQSPRKASMRVPLLALGGVVLLGGVAYLMSEKAEIV